MHLPVEGPIESVKQAYVGKVGRKVGRLKPAPLFVLSNLLTSSNVNGCAHACVYVHARPPARACACAPTCVRVEKGRTMLGGWTDAIFMRDSAVRPFPARPTLGWTDRTDPWSRQRMITPMLDTLVTPHRTLVVVLAISTGLTLLDPAEAFHHDPDSRTHLAR